MGLTERVWDAFARTIQLADKVELFTATIAKPQHPIEDLTVGPALGASRRKPLSGPAS